jgi:hypothetical protein
LNDKQLVETEGRANERGVIVPTPMETLLLKLDAWLVQQPEYSLLFLAPRATRRQAANLVARHLLTIPTRKP